MLGSKQVKTMIKVILLTMIAIVAAMPVAAARPSDDAEVRAAVEVYFQDLKGAHYSALYDGLPAAARKRMTRQRFVDSMKQSRDLYSVDRIEIGAVHVNGNNATADTTMYGRVLKPNEADGKIVLRQHLVREGGAWRLAVNTATPQVYIMKNGRWVNVTALLKSGGRRR
jgi:hypothetical protein